MTDETQPKKFDSGGLERAWARITEESHKREEARLARRAEHGPVEPILFGLYETECENYRNWYSEHYEKCWMVNYKLAKSMGKPTAAIGGAITFQFTRTSIGTVCSVKCACGEKKDCTEYDDW